MTAPLLDIQHLSIQSPYGARPAVDDISLTVHKGEVLALIGESGSGKTTLALSALGHIRSGLAVRHGTVRLAGMDMLNASIKDLERVRGRSVSYIAQSAALAFNERLRLDAQVTEPALVHGALDRDAAAARAHELYRALDLPDPDAIGSRYPHQVSGGQLQRFMIAMGVLLHPRLLVCDEPTSALDVTTQVDVLWALKQVIKDHQTAALFVSHDLAVVAQIADRIAVLRHGRLVELGPTAQILTRPEHDYTRQLIDACNRWPARTAQAYAPEAAPGRKAAGFLDVRDLRASYGPASARGEPRRPVLQDVSLQVGQGEIVAVIGESGSGKSTLAKVISGLHPKSQGRINVDGVALADTADARTTDQLRRVQMVFQSADTALNSKHTVGQILGRVLKLFGTAPPDKRQDRINALLEMVRLPAHYARRKPGQLSGGEKQRVNLARALAAEPEVLLCDEITSALDTVVAAAIIELVKELRDRLSLAIIFISHDMATVASIADKIVVLQHGRVVESGPAASVFDAPSAPYSRLLRGVGSRAAPGVAGRAHGPAGR